MKPAIPLMKMMALGAVAMFAAIFWWPFAVAGMVAWFVAGMVAWFVAGMRFNRWFSSAVALLAAIVWRLTAGEWSLHLGDPSHANGFVEIMSGILNWAWAAIWVSAFANWPGYFIQGYRSIPARSA